MADHRLKLLAGTALALTGAACAGGAMADTSLGWYAAVDAGSGPVAAQSLKVTDVTLQSAATTATPPLTAGSYELTPDYAGRGFARVGYRFTPNLRTELELGARPGKLKSGLGGTDLLDLGSFDKSSLMANLIFDFMPESGIHPFVGVGAGVVRASTDYREPVSKAGHDLVYSVRSDATMPAGQFLAGASLDVTQRLHFDMTYRYMRTGSGSYAVAVSDSHGGSIDSYTAKAQGPIEDHSVTVGFRWTFGAPARSRAAFTSDHADAATRPVAASPVAYANPAPAGSATVAAARPTVMADSRPAVNAGNGVMTATDDPQDDAGAPDAGSDDAGSGDVGGGDGPAVPAAAPLAAKPGMSAGMSLMTAPMPRQYTAYFPFGGSRLTASAQSVVVEAAQFAQSAPDAHVMVDGYADTSGSMAYNLALSRRRAHAVADTLVNSGVPGDVISIAWHGETHLAVKTGDGRPNAKNRRVTIHVQFSGGHKARHYRGRHHRRHRH